MNKVKLLPLTVKPEYAQAIHTAVFYLNDWHRAGEIKKTKSSVAFREKYKEELLELHRFIFNQFNYELSDMQMSKAVAIFLM